MLATQLRAVREVPTALQRASGSCRRHVRPNQIGRNQISHFGRHVTLQAFSFRPQTTHLDLGSDHEVVSASSPLSHPNRHSTRSRCCPAPLPAPPLRWSPAEASTPPALVCPRLTTTPRAPTATSPSTPAASGSALVSGPSWVPVSSLPSVSPSGRPTSPPKFAVSDLGLALVNWQIPELGWWIVVYIPE